MKVELLLGDCLDLMLSLKDKSIDAIIADWPYGTTAYIWDRLIPLEPLWSQCKRVIKNNGAIVLFCSQPFTTLLIADSPYFGTNKQWFKYEWIWVKSKATGFLDARRKPLKGHETIAVFYNKQPAYNPQGLIPVNIKSSRINKIAKGKIYNSVSTREYYQKEGNFPKSVLYFPIEPQRLNSSQKPVALMEYLIKTYTNPGDTVLDNTMGSGSTGVACVNTNRNFIGMELDEGYFNIAKQRIQKSRIDRVKGR